MESGSHRRSVPWLGPCVLWDWGSLPILYLLFSPSISPSRSEICPIANLSHLRDMKRTSHFNYFTCLIPHHRGFVRCEDFNFIDRSDSYILFSYHTSYTSKHTIHPNTSYFSAKGNILLFYRLNLSGAALKELTNPSRGWRAVQTRWIF